MRRSKYGRYPVLWLALWGAAALASPLARGQIYVANSGNGVNGGAIAEYDLSGAAMNARLVPLPNNVAGVAVSGSDLFTTCYDYGTGVGVVGEYTTSGATINASLIPGLHNPLSIAVSGQNLFVVNEYPTVGTIGEYGIDGTLVNASLISGLRGPTDIAVSGANLFVTSYTGGTIGEYTTTGAMITASLVPGLSSPVGIAVAGSNLYVANYYAGTIGEYTTSGAVVNASLVSGLTYPQGIAVVGSKLYVATHDSLGGTGRVGEYSAIDGTPINGSLVSSTLFNPQRIVVVPEPATGSIAAVAGLALLVRRPRRRASRRAILRQVRAYR